MRIDINKNYKTRDGRDVRIIRINAESWDNNWPVVGCIGEKDGADLWTSEGKNDLKRESNLDLIEVVETEAKDTSAMVIDINKNYKTRDGQDVRVVKIHPESKGYEWPVVGCFGEERVCCKFWNLEGKYDLERESDLDLIEVVETEAKDTSAMKIDITKKYKTRDGRDVEINKVLTETWDRYRYLPVEGYIGKEEYSRLWTSEGKYHLERESNEDLIEVIETATPPKSRKRDMVNNPIHYGTGDIECIDYIQDFLTEEEYIGYLRGNIAKYLHRWRYKNGLEDLKKSEWYGAKLIKLMENK